MLCKKTLEKLFEKDDNVRLDEIVKTKTKIEKVNKRMITLQNQNLDGCITPEEYHMMKQRAEKDMIDASESPAGFVGFPQSGHFKRVVTLPRCVHLVMQKLPRQSKVATF